MCGMKLFAILLGALALVAGFSGGMRAYSVSADAGPAPVRPVSAAQVAPRAWAAASPDRAPSSWNPQP